MMRVRDDYIPEQKQTNEKTAPDVTIWGLFVCSLLGILAAFLLNIKGLFRSNGAVAQQLIALAENESWLLLYGNVYFVLLLQACLILVLSLCCLGGMLLPILFGLYGGALYALAADAVLAQPVTYWELLWIPVALGYTLLTIFAGKGFRQAVTLGKATCRNRSEGISCKITLVHYFYTCFGLALVSGLTVLLAFLFVRFVR